jgi:hypothetical protein
MMSEAPPPLPPDIASLLATERELDDVSEHERASIRAAVLGAVGAGAALPSPSPAAPVARSGASVLRALALGVAVGAAGGFLVGRGTKPDAPAPATPSVPIVVAAPSASVLAPAPDPIASVDELPNIPQTVTSARPRASAVPPASASNAPGEGLTNERTLLERARAALARGDATAALAALEEHERRFAGGSLEEEREVLAVRTLVAAGRRADAEQRAATFRARHPGSLFLPMIDRALAVDR